MTPPIAPAATAADRAPGGGVIVAHWPLSGPLKRAGERGGHRLVGQVKIGEVVKRRVL
jgi:hypothetical protein